MPKQDKKTEFPPRIPKDKWEREAVGKSRSRQVSCSASSPGLKYCCTRTNGHAGDHVAGLSTAKIVARWERGENVTIKNNDVVDQGSETNPEER